MSLCAMFAFEGVDDANLLHCTHRYFGDEYTGGEEKVIKELQDYFAAKPFKSFRVKFDQLKQLGEEKDYRTLTTSEREPFLLDLKERLDKIHPDKWPEYIPHVTVGRNTDALDKPIRDYVLMKDHKPIWSAAQHTRRMRAQLVADFRGEGKSMEDFEADLDEAAVGHRARTPEEMLQDPRELLDPDGTDAQRRAGQPNGAWDDAEGRGSHKWGIVG